MNQNVRNDKPSLSPLLDEFRIALQDEIEVAKRNASNSAIPLSNGQKIAERASAYQYAFMIDSVLNTPDGTPGDLIVSGKAPIEVTIVSVEGLRLVLSIGIDLGQFVPTARLQTNLTILMRKLIERIEVNANSQNPAAERMLGSAPVDGKPYKITDKPTLNDEQLNALQSALGRNLTIIWGPPGTGKTHTIGTITEYLYKQSRSVLLVSHTNIAVDQAVKHVAKTIKEKLPEGILIRIGEVRDDVLQSDFPDVLIKVQVERRSRELIEQREKFIIQKQLISDEMTAIQEEITIVEWLKSAKEEIELIELKKLDIENLEQEKQKLIAKHDALKEQHSNLLEIHKHIARILELQKIILTKKEYYSNLTNKINISQNEYEQLTKKIASRIELAERINKFRNESRALPSQEEQKEVISALSVQILDIRKKFESTQNELNKANELLSAAQNVGTIGRVIRFLPNPEKQKGIIENLSHLFNTQNTDLEEKQKIFNFEKGKLEYIERINEELTRYDYIGTMPVEIELKKITDQKLKHLSDKLTELVEEQKTLQTSFHQIEDEIAQLSKEFEGDVKELYIGICSQLQMFKELPKSIESIEDQISQIEKQINNQLSHLISMINQWEEFKGDSSLLTERLKLIRDAHNTLSNKFKSVDLESLLKMLSTKKSEILKLIKPIDEIDAKLALIEREVINKASIIGATLTKTYLSDDIQGRKFDTVILDEASMAPIPAVWSAAILAQNNLIIVGDFKQLPPIVLSKNESTIKWLGRDIFEASGLKDKYENNTDLPEYFIKLVKQRRMLPEIAKVANLFYNNELQNVFTTPDQYGGFQNFTEWYIKDWPHDSPVTLIDTGPLNAWVTSVVKNGNSSRLNFLSATVSVDISQQLFSSSIEKRIEGTSKRILIISPYRAHAKLVSLLLKSHANIQDEIVAGTAHSFQGSEADVVIFDMVVDEPQFRVNLFIPMLDEQIKCFLNVALTRAKFRLFILGDFDYCLKLGKKAFIGSTLIPFLLKQFSRIDARTIIPDGLAARAAKTQMSMLGGEIDPASDRIIVTQIDFYRILSSDISRAKNRLIIYSPFMTPDRVSFLLPQLQAATERNVQIYVITKAHSERSNSELMTIKKIETQLSEIGIIVIHKLRMHEKLIFIDENITWSGSLNPLSFSNTQEIMERRNSKTVLADYFKILRLQELLEVQSKPESKCPICGSEMIAAEGADEPYYWRCLNDECFTRGINQPYPFNGLLNCANCNAPVEYGYWGDYPHWRCKENNRHRQKIFKSHLRLPKMAALVPKRERKKLCSLLKIDDFDEYVIKTTSENSLFD